MKVLMLHDCAGVSLTLSRFLRMKGFKVDLYFFAEKDDPYLQAYKKYMVGKTGLSCGLFLFKKLLENYDIIHSYNTRFPNHPLPYDYLFAKLKRRKVVIHFHGSDLRLRAHRLTTKILFTNKTLLVSTPDLLEYCPSHAVWLPNPVDPKMFSSISSQPHDSFRILHSDTTPPGFKSWDWQKGTFYLERSVKELKQKGFNVELLNVGWGVENIVPHKKMPELYRWCDAVVNEVLLPIHSLVGIEGMMSGKPVLSSYNPKFSDAPIVRITPSTLTGKLVELIESPNYRRKLGVEGREWALKYHDPERVVEKLIRIYENA